MALSTDISGKLTLVLVAVSAGMAAAGEPVRPPAVQPAERFVMRPFGSDMEDWWRPLAVVDPRGEVPGIAEAIRKHSLEPVRDRPLHDVLGAHAASPLVFPAAVAAGPAGREVLIEVLARYRGRKPLNGRWILTVAGLGRIPSAESATALRAELLRVIREYDLFDTPADRPVLDALLACEAGRGALTAEKLDELGDLSPATGREWTWWMGPAWAGALMPRDAVVQIILDGLAKCSTEELEARLEMHPIKGRETGLRYYLAGPPREVWPVFDELLARSPKLDPLRGDWVRSNYLSLVVYYRAALADDGGFQPEDRIAPALMTPPLRPWPLHSESCAVLERCRGHADPRSDWERFTSGHAKVAPENAEMLETLVSNAVNGRATLRETVERKPASVVNIDSETPGVHIQDAKVVLGPGAEKSPEASPDGGDVRRPIRKQANDVR